MLRRLRRRPDDGSSLVELVVAMGIVSFLVAAYLSATMLMARTTTRAAQVAQASTQLRAAVDAIGRSAASASGVNAPVTSGGNVYLELYQDDVPSGTAPLCTQWVFRPATQLLQVRSWNIATVAPTTWRTVARDVGNPLPARPPFAVTTPDPVHTLPVVTVDVLVSPVGLPSSATTSAFTVRNYDNSLGTVCTQVART